jgi:hypothetical protein
MRKYSYNTQIFNDRTEEAMYISGLASADGIFGKSGLEFKLHSRDLDILQKIRDCVCQEHPIYDYRKHGDCMMLQLGSQYIKDVVRIIISDQTSNPTSIAFIRGFFDGDGTITRGNLAHKYPYKAGFYNYSKDKLSSISMLLGEYGFNRNKPSYHGDNCYALWYCGSSSEKLYDVMYDNATIYGNRKKTRFEELLFSGRVGVLPLVNAPHLMAEVKG